MGIVKRQGLKLSIASYVGALIGMLNIFIFPGIFTDRQIGVFMSVILPIAALVGLFMLLGSNVVALKFFPKFKNNENGHNGMLSAIHIWVLVGAFLVVLFSLIGLPYLVGAFPNLSHILEYRQYILPTTLFLGLASLYNVLCQNFRRIVVPGILLRSGIKFTLLGGGALYYFKLIDFSQFLWLVPLNYFVVCVVLLFYMIKVGKYTFSWPVTFWQQLPKKEIVSNGMFGLFLGVGSTIVFSIDLLMVPMLTTLESGGHYVIAERMSQMIEIPTSALLTIIAPLLATAWSNKDKAEIQKLYSSSSLNLLIIGFLMAIGLVINLNNLYDIMPNGEIYRSGYYVAIFLVAGKLVEMSTSCNHSIILLSDRYRINFYILGVLAILNITLNLILVPKLGPKGAAIATATSLVLVNVFKTIYIRKVFGYSPFSKQTLYLVIVGLIVLGIGFFLPKISSPFLDLIVRSTVVSLLYIVTVYKMRISEDLNHLLDKYTKGLLAKVLGGK